MHTCDILGTKIAVSSYAETAATCVQWAKRGESRTVVFANVHVVMEANDNAVLASRLHNTDMVNPDGVPLVWALKAVGERRASRVYGPDATLVILREAEKAGIPVGFYGGSEEALNKLIASVKARFPDLQIVFTMSPPFRAMSAEEDDAVVQQIVASGARMLFVGLGCPKQEHWVAEHRGRIPAVLLAVGAAFDFIAGTKPQAPRWMMKAGLEWIFRLATEPRRLAGRYFKNNPRFILLFAQQWLRVAVLNRA